METRSETATRTARPKPSRTPVPMNGVDTLALFATIGAVRGQPELASFAPPRCLSGMRGVITGKDVVRHSITIVRLFGPRCYLRCLRAALSSTPSTFLQVVSA